jgi:uncharacterized circularly permuted ATP-grasp superfamily protein
VLENRSVMKRVFPVLFGAYRVRGDRGLPVQPAPHAPVRRPAPRARPDDRRDDAGRVQLGLLRAQLPRPADGRELVEGRDLLVDNNFVYMRTTGGLRRVDVIYRRIDDDFIDPLTFRPDSVLGVPGLMNAYRCGNVALANACGTGVADDKAVYPYVPRMIKFYLGQTRSCRTSRRTCAPRTRTARTCWRTSTSWS